ncbi:MAG: hypothetical protein DRJ60_02625 [Thermoprotei archaeon]|nr:MAG: hypothetical protein DRJ60_02625 [Thermoprotei archaeon]
MKVKLKAYHLIILATFFVIAIYACSLSVAYAEKSFSYKFYVDDNGHTNVTVFFYDTGNGSSWILIPKSQRDCVSITAYRGDILNVSYQKLIEEGEENPFYVVMKFKYETRDVVNLSISYSMSYGSLIIEPDAIFISPRVTHEETGFTKTITFLPGYAITNKRDVSSFSGFIKDVEVTKRDDHVVVEVSISSDDRVVIEYSVPFHCNMADVTIGSFTFKTPSRYLDFAYDILKTLNESYAIYKDVFGTELKNVEIQFFVPSMRDLITGLEGYVPFEAGKLGAIYLNVLYIRGVEGFMDVIALHELAHHFLWAIGVPPSRLWIHEGVAEYLSLTIGRSLGYAKAVDMHEGGLVSVWKELDDNLGFVQKWTPFYTPPQGLRYCYAASYYIFKTLCDEYGELSYLKRLFKLFKGIDWSNDTQIVEVFGLAANNVTGIFALFHKWGFEFKEPLQMTLLISRVKRDVLSMPIWLEPYRSFAGIAIWIAELLQQYNVPCGTALMIKASELVYNVSPYLLLVSLVIVVMAIILSRRV